MLGNCVVVLPMHDHAWFLLSETETLPTFSICGSILLLFKNWVVGFTYVQFGCGHSYCQVATKQTSDHSYNVCNSD
jgi:hypothetical protein